MLATSLLAVSLLLPGEGGGDCVHKTYGAGLRLAETTPVEDLLARPEEFVGRAVRVDGEVVEVCEMAGCWMAIRAGGAAAGGAVRVKVADGEIVFPVSARGKPAAAEGGFERLEMTRERFLAYQRHLAEEQGKTFDPATVGDGPYRVYQITGTGAEICE
jgi:hypothetical protein